jgi:hypothetical protein
VDTRVFVVHDFGSDDIAYWEAKRELKRPQSERIKLWSATKGEMRQRQ